MLLLAGCVTGGAVEPPIISPGGRTPPALERSYAEAGLRVETVATGLDTPWDLVFGPDGFIWMTERPGRLSRLDPVTGALTVIAEIPSYERGESGLLGLELHPDFDSRPFVYVVQSYAEGESITNRLVRYRFDGGALSDRTVLLDGIPGNTYHDGARLEFGPDGLLYLTTGDAGRARLAQEIDSLNGKILRLTASGDPAPGNPFGNEVWTYGHRNAQGLVYDPGRDRFFITEHGPDDNDEVAVVKAGENHGWPAVHGFCDDDVPGESDFCAERDVAEPLAAWTPTIAPAGADIHRGELLSEWNGDVLFVTLKGSSLVRLVLSADGRTVEQQVVYGRGEFGRLRDVVVGPDGAVYIATSNRDGRGVPDRSDDRILRVVPE